jgi:UDP-N-acetylglucosamine 2-epimerase (hydrolysing)
VGSRQNRRAFAPSITAASAFDTDTIDQFLAQAWGRRFAPDHSFGSGQAAQGFVQVLDDAGFWQQSLQKAFGGVEGGVECAADSGVA